MDSTSFHLHRRFRGGRIMIASLAALGCVAFFTNVAVAKNKPYKRFLKQEQVARIIKAETARIMPGHWDHHLFWSLVGRESNFNMKAVSNKQAYGLTQVRYVAAAAVGMTKTYRLSPRHNIRAGLKYLKLLYDSVGRGLPDGHQNGWQRTKVAMAAYLAGPGNLRKARRWVRKRGLALTWPNIKRALVSTFKAGRMVRAYVHDIFKAYNQRKAMINARRLLSRHYSSTPRRGKQDKALRKLLAM